MGVRIKDTHFYVINCLCSLLFYLNILLVLIVDTYYELYVVQHKHICFLISGGFKCNGDKNGPKNP